MPDKPSIVWHICTGEAHKDEAHYDHCMVCLPYWGQYPVCPVCGYKIQRLNEKVYGNKSGGNPWCHRCRKHYAWGDRIER